MTAERDRARWALRDDRTLSRTAKLVWLMLDSRGVDPHPSLAKLAADCGAHRSSVKRALHELAAGGWLRIDYRTTQQGCADTNHYALMCPAQEGVGSPMNPPGGCTSEPGVGAPMNPKDQQEDQQVEETPTTTAYAGAPAGRASDFGDPETNVIKDISEQVCKARGYGLDEDEERRARGMLLDPKVRTRKQIINAILNPRRQGSAAVPLPGAAPGCPECAQPPGTHYGWCSHRSDPPAPAPARQHDAISSLFVEG